MNTPSALTITPKYHVGAVVESKRHGYTYIVFGTIRIAEGTARWRGGEGTQLTRYQIDIGPETFWVDEAEILRVVEQSGEDND